MYQDVIVAGFGGQGVLLIGNVLAQAAMEAGVNVTFMPVYGVEMRGGTANCTVVISDQEIGSPIIHAPMSLIAMNQPSLSKFLPRLQPGGVIILNSSIADADCVDTSAYTLYAVPANKIADELGTVKMSNMVALGAWIAATQALPLQSVRDVVAAQFAPKGDKLVQANDRALVRGAEQLSEACC